MKAINSSSTTGPEAIFTAVISWWLAENPIKERTLKWLECQAPDALLDRTDHRIGARILQDVEFVQDFWVACISNHAVHHVVGLAQTNWISTSSLNAREFVKFQIQTEIGVFVKETDWFQRNARVIHQEKKRLKCIKGVMDS